jgi:hypothetical protein
MRGTILLGLLAVVAGGGLALAHWSAGAPRAPGIGDVQGAYDGAAASSGSQHIPGLKVLGVQCDKSAKARYSCEVGFSLPHQDDDRVYLDVALVERSGARWKLLAGLCKRYN